MGGALVCVLFVVTLFELFGMLVAVLVVMLPVMLFAAFILVGWRCGRFSWLDRSGGFLSGSFLDRKVVRGDIIAGTRSRARSPCRVISAFDHATLSGCGDLRVVGWSSVICVGNTGTTKRESSGHQRTCCGLT